MSAERLLVISGVRTGIGRSLALAGAAHGYAVFGCASSPAARLETDGAMQELLTSGTLHYVRADVGDRAQVDRFHEAVREAAGDGPFDEVVVIANAGIARWGDPGEPEVFAEIEKMRRVNVRGAEDLANAFAPDLAAATTGRYVAMSSIVAAEGQAIGGNIHYTATKIENLYHATGVVPNDPAFDGVASFAVAPGVVLTPMVLEEALVPLLLRATVVAAAKDRDVCAELSELAPGASFANATPASLLRALLSDVMGHEPERFERFERALGTDTDLTRLGLTGLMRAAKKHADLRDRVIEILYALDLAVTPDFVAERVFAQFDDPTPPRNGILKVYSRNGHNPILRLMKTL